MGKDILLDENTHDLKFVNNNLVLIGFEDDRESKLRRVQQRVKTRLLFFAGEWYKDTSQGVTYYDEVLIKNPNVPRIETVLKVVILETDEIDELIEFQSDFDNATRKYTVSFTAKTPFGNIALTEVLP